MASAPDDLRDQITAAIERVDDWRGVTDPSILADAVIEALKTDPSIMFMTHVCGEGCSCE